MKSETTNNSDLIIRTEEEQKRSIEIYDSSRDELLKRQLSNTENYDKSILTLSSAGLAISLTFLRSLVPIEKANSLWLVKASWGCFLTSIILSLIAYLISNAAITKQLKITEDYYVNKIASAFNKKNWLSSINNWLNYVVGLLFVAAITTVVIFVTINLKKEGNPMSKKETKVTSQNVKIEKSAIIPAIQIVPTDGEKVMESAKIPKMQPAPGSTSQSPQNQKPSDKPQGSES